MVSIVSQVLAIWHKLKKQEWDGIYIHHALQTTDVY